MKNTVAFYTLLTLLFIEIKAVSILQNFAKDPSGKECIGDKLLFLGPDGTLAVTASDFVSDCPTCQVERNGQALSEFNCEDIGKPIWIEITGGQAPLEISCPIRVQDSIKPIFENCPDTAIYGNIDFALNNPDSVGITTFDNCAIDTLFGVVCSTDTDVKCPDTAMVVKIRWTAVDLNGNRTVKDQEVTFLKVPMAQVVYPEDTILDCDLANLLDNIPSPTYTNVPIDIFSGLTVSGPELLDSAIFCDGNRIYDYRWRLYDPCLGLVEGDTFRITFIDTTAPSCMFLQDIDTLYLDAMSCSTVIDEAQLQNPIITEEGCFNDSIVFEQYKLDGEIIANGYQIELKEGCYTIELTLADDCWNFGSCSYKLVVLDTTSPSLVCPEDVCRVITFNEFFGSSGDCDEIIYPLPDSLYPEFLSGCCGISDTIVDTVYDDSDCRLYTGAPNEDNAVVLQFHVLDSCGNRSDTCRLRFCIEQSSRRQIDDNDIPQLTISNLRQMSERISVFSIQGILMYQGSANQFAFETNTLPAGLYFLQLKGELSRVIIP